MLTEVLGLANKVASSIVVGVQIVVPPDRVLSVEVSGHVLDLGLPLLMNAEEEEIAEYAIGVAVVFSEDVFSTHASGNRPDSLEAALLVTEGARAVGFRITEVSIVLL